MITAKKKVEKYYTDLQMDKEYEVSDIRSYLFLKHNKRHYQLKYFKFFKDGEPITQKDARKYIITKTA